MSSLGWYAAAGVVSAAAFFLMLMIAKQLRKVD